MRILVASVWLWELLHNLRYVEELYSPVVSHARVWWLAWILATVALLVGLGTRVAAAVAFLAAFVLVYRGREIYHVDYFAQLTFFYLIFIDSGRVWSVDSLLRRWRGGGADRTVRHLPVLVFMVHVSSAYLDAAGAHWFLNDSWRGGDAVVRSFAQPQWASDFGGSLANEGLQALEVLNYGTIAAEASLIVLVGLYVLDRHRKWALVISFAIGVGLHLGIWITYDLGVFSAFMIGLCTVFLPRRPVGGPDDRGDVIQRLEVVALGAVALVVIAMTVPMTRAAEHTPLGRSLTSPGLFALRAIGDARPHDVFADPHITAVFAITVRDSRGEVVPLLFDRSGDRVGELANMRVFMDWYKFGWTAAHRLLDGEGLRLSSDRLVALLVPRLDVAVDAGQIRLGEDLSVEFQAWRIDARGRRVDARGPIPLCRVRVSAPGQHSIECSGRPAPLPRR